jgi:F420-0:gamma-glutamyl ligase
MIKLILPLLISTGLLSAFNAEVKKDSVSLLINDQAQNYEVGKTFALKAGDLVCFVSGEGRVVLKGEKYSKQLSKRSKNCKRLPTANKETKDYLALSTKRIIANFENAKETSVAGVSTRSVTTGETITTPLTIKRGVKYLIIENDKWGPLPVSIQIVDTQGEVVAMDSNEEELVTTFVFPVSVLKEGYTIKVVNAFDELLVKSEIHF